MPQNCWTCLHLAEKKATKTLRGVQWCSRQFRGDESDGRSTLEYSAATTGVKQKCIQQLNT